MTKCSHGGKLSLLRRSVGFADAIAVKENEAMTGIRYLTDENGRKVAVQIDLKKHRELWEDLQDVLVSRSRRHEKRIPLDKVKTGLIKSGKLPRE
jgi:hypothetical protein